MTPPLVVMPLDVPGFADVMRWRGLLVTLGGIPGINFFCPVDGGLFQLDWVLAAWKALLELERYLDSYLLPYPLELTGKGRSLMSTPFEVPTLISL